MLHLILKITMKSLYPALCVLLLAASTAAAQSDKISYDKHGRITSVRYANGQEIRYEYDARNNLTSVTNVVTSVDESTEPPAVSVRPNPASDQATIEIPATAGTAVTVQLVSTDGRLLFRRQILSDASGMARLQIDAETEGLAPGQYQVSVATLAGRTTTALTIAR